MSINVTAKHVSVQTYSVIAVTISFVAVALILTGLVTRVVATMTHSATELDDARANHLTRTVVAELSEHLEGTTANNALSNDAYAAIGSHAAAEFAYKMWGKTSKDTPVYDGVVVSAPDGSIVSAYLKGQSFQPDTYFGYGFRRQVEAAAKPGQRPLVNFFKTKDGVSLVSSQAIQPSEISSTLPKLSTLSFYKELRPEMLDALADEHELDGLRLQAMPEPGLLSAPVKDMDGAEIAYFVWPSRAPGDALFRKVYPDVIAAGGILALFLAAVLLAGAAEAKRLRRSAETARFEADHDSLSGLLNRHGLLKELEQSDGAASASLYLIDLDRFKAVNDAWGHAVGDELIRIVATALRDCHPEIRAVARLGGDEFALVHVGSVGRHAIQSSILAIFIEPFRINGRTIEVGASIGVAPQTGSIPPLELLRRADMALYRAKENGKGQAIVYELELDRERQRIADLEDELRKAIDGGAIEPVFQPLVCASTEAIIGVEALARWRSPAGNISPEIFIPLAEKSGLIDALGIHMLRTSIVHAQNWSNLSLSVNVSPVQLCNPDFAGQVIAVLEEAGFDAKRLSLEITEGVLISNPEQARRSIDQLRHVGIKFALDDFGCGFASIGALRLFGFDRMKIDRSLVSGLGENPRGVDVLRATVALASALDIPVTAEGVENIQQAELLRETGCDQFQGYLLGKPMSADEISSKLSLENRAA
ncbi:EAL domain-containing protein (plasmid) [Rhizobium sp. CB3090]|uniref:bifunctional diguanylate cyclase/phosphodiesterase n=1 Tax=Rhizobium sp. CB3090 TaxID=3039156 RepID=UPI0024B13A34|nr:EAL domain-containing protein [Rhizobium sp. CB3090]WFU12915.1 EAL domain-containing protein [Rhizobium sp. CB3090]